VSVKHSPKGKKNILFVCCGNRERSLIAETLLYQRLEKEYTELVKKVEISSAGILPRAYLERARRLGVTFVAPYFGKSPNIYAVKYLTEKGIDVSSYRSRKLTKRLVLKADLILAMDKVLKDEIIDVHSKASGRVLALKEFVFGPDCPDLNIGDPMALPEIDAETGVWVWPDGYAANYINEIEHCFKMGMEKFVGYINGTINP
jgi:protein-tyrosine-phosphatase